MASTPPLLELPVEIRLTIYKLLLSNPTDRIVSIRTEDPALHKQRRHTPRLRTKYHHISDRLRNRSTESTYYLRHNPGIHPGILGTNRQIHAEANHVLYSTHIFDFGLDIESAVPFLQDLGPRSRAAVAKIRIVKRAIPYTKSYDHCEWASACSYFSAHLRLAQLHLAVLGGSPGSMWGVPLSEVELREFSKADFEWIAELEDMEWMRQLAAVGGLRALTVQAIMEHCPPPQSSAMTFFVAFSASIEKGFREHMTSVMVAKAY